MAAECRLRWWPEGEPNVVATPHSQERRTDVLHRVPLGERLTGSSNLLLRSGNEIPVLGFGSWMLTTHTAEAVQHAFELGYRMVDTSADYHTQSGIGRAIRRHGAPRESLFVITKIETDDDGFAATRRNLSELKLAYVDLVLIHEPPEKGVGEKLWQGLMRARDEGLTRDIGVCNYKIPQLEALAIATGEMPAVQQLEWTPFGHSLDMLNFCRAHQIVVQAYSPLTRGKRLQDERLKELAARHGKSPAQVMLRWNLQHGVAPIPKAYREDHQRDNVDVFDFELDELDMATLDGFNEHFSAIEKLEYL
jgi:2,5-diketo-D-gluconate reductase A